MSKTEAIIAIETLTIGHYVHLDLAWLDHPFAFGHFKVSSEEQLRTIRGLGLTKVRVDLAKSEVVSSPLDSALAPVEINDADAAPSVEMLKKRERIVQNQVLRSRIAACEKKFVESAKVCKEIGRTIFSSPAESIARAKGVVEQLADSLLSDSDAIIHLLGDKVAGEEVYHHSLNVATLSVLLGRELALPRGLIEQTGLATILHDLGKVEIPDRVLLKKETWTNPERELYQTHVQHSVTIAHKAGAGKEVMLIIAQHHEMIDGKGFPNGLKAEQICPGAKLLSLINSYDNLCNPVDIVRALTPHEALSLMFTKQRSRYDSVMLSKLVHVLGVYPPGTVVTLSNGAIGMVISINSRKPLRPTVIVYDPDIPRAEAITVNLEEEKDISISKALRPAQLPRPVFDYLSPRQRITYSFDQSRRSGS